MPVPDAPVGAGEMPAGPPDADGRRDPPGMAVLVVDDEIRLAAEIADALSDEGHVVHLAGSGRAALDLLARHPEIGVMISDIRMPDMDGLELTRSVLAGRDDGRALEVILITGHATVEDAIAAVRIGAFDFVRKPFRLRDLFDATARAKGRALGRRRIGATAPPIAARDGGDLTGSLPLLQGLMHELRTPLVPVLGFAELLEMPRYGAEVREFAGHVRAGAVLMLESVNDLLVLAEIERGGRTAATGAFDLREMLGRVAADAAMPAGAAGVTVSLDGGDTKAWHGDPELLRRALRVLLHVAIHRTPRGSAIQLSGQATEAGAVLEVVVARGGRPAAQPGAVEDLEGTARQVAPLGLRLAQAVAALHGGALALTADAMAIYRARLSLGAGPANG
jgi:CheY-like chemotaxis protein